MQVKSVQFKDLAKRYRLNNGRRIQTHRFACLGPGDDVVYRSAKDAHVRCRNGIAKLLPAYQAVDDIEVGQRRVSVTVKEIETEAELRGYVQLSQYHYRGKELHGRRSPLILVCHDPLLPNVLGYIELATAFLMNKPRAAVLSAPFTDPESGIHWTEWNKDTVRQYTNLVVRIARTVVSPEFRGLGLASLLARHAANYAREHWNVGGLKPLFIEITADMLRYVPFVERAGMHYIGMTEGNLNRLTKDMAYVLRNLRRVQRREILSVLAERASFVSMFDGVDLRQTIDAAHPQARMVFGLVHTLSHAALRHAGMLCGLDPTSLAEYVLPRALSLAIYSNQSFGATIGALTALFEQSMEDWLGRIAGTRRCLYDPVCAVDGGACHACAHASETSCRFFNVNLGRQFLFGGHDAVLGQVRMGFFDFVRQTGQAAP